MDEAEFYKDVVHGIAREWTSSGVLVSEFVCEFGITMSERRWDDDGTLTDEFHLKESDSNFALLQSFRKAYGPTPK
ncbi:hypothetical protein [Myxococcus stipitatus]|uniref:hypothetical protein n=1 Tax=Myxococcus stipitatus TaxID=83455 RepID=UPI0030CF0D52